MSRSKVAASLLVVALAVSGCAHGSASHPPGQRSRVPLDNPSTSPLITAPDATTTPRALTGQPSLPVVEEDASSGGSRAAAEQYALDVVHLLTDVRPGIDGGVALGRIASTTMTAATRAFLVQDMDIQHESRLGRHFDTSLDMWIRSHPQGPADAPTRVAVEVAGNLAAAWGGSETGGGFHAWVRMRLDVVREHDEWHLDGFSAGPIGVHTSRNLTAAQQRDFLTGPGWRRIPAA
jgi:hypothetical protein